MRRLDAVLQMLPRGTKQEAIDEIVEYGDVRAAENVLFTWLDTERLGLDYITADGHCDGAPKRRYFGVENVTPDLYRETPEEAIRAAMKHADPHLLRARRDEDFEEEFNTGEWQAEREEHKERRMCEHGDVEMVEVTIPAHLSHTGEARRKVVGTVNRTPERERTDTERLDALEASDVEINGHFLYWSPRTTKLSGRTLRDIIDAALSATPTEERNDA